MVETLKSLGHHIYDISDGKAYTGGRAIVIYSYCGTSLRPWEEHYTIEISGAGINGDINIMQKAINSATIKEEAKRAIETAIRPLVSPTCPSFNFIETSAGHTNDYYHNGQIVDRVAVTHLPAFGYNTFRISDNVRNEKLASHALTTYLQHVKTGLDAKYP
jgi:hypothetical protein